MTTFPLPEIIAANRPNHRPESADAYKKLNARIDIHSDFAVPTDGTDGTAALQAAVDYVDVGVGVPGIRLDLPPGEILLTDTITIQRKAVMLLGAGRGNNPEDANPGRGTTFRWGGPAGQPMFHCYDTAALVVEDVTILGDPANPPSEAFFFESTVGESGQYNEWMVFQRVQFGSYDDSGQFNHCVRFGGINGNNDQGVWRDCQFLSSTVALFKIDNTQSIWSVLDNCLFAPDLSAATTAKGLVTSSSILGINCQFDNCSPDVEINSTAKVTLIQYNSERSKKLINLTSDGAFVHVIGGLAQLSDVVGGFYIEHASCSSGGGILLNGWRALTGTASPRPEIKVRGLVGAQLGYVTIRDCNLPVADYDFVAAASGDGILVSIDDSGQFDRFLLNSGATYAAGWHNWTPTLGGGWAVGDGTMVARYQKIGRTVIWNIQVQWAAGSTFGVGQLTFSMPVAAEASFLRSTSHARAIDQGTASYTLDAQHADASTVGLYTVGAAGINASVTSTVPFAFVATDKIMLGGSFEAAA